MRALVVYDSVFGNTEKVARAVAAALGCEAKRVGETRPEDLAGVDLAAGGRRIGQGFNLDAARISSLVLYQEIAFRFSTDEDYAARAFEFFRAFVGYAFTTRRGTNVTFGLLGQVSLNPAATRYDFLWGPVLGVAHRFRASRPDAPPQPPDAEVQ